MSPASPPPRYRHVGLTLIELVVVLTVLAALAGLVVPLISRQAADARVSTTQASLRQIRDVILNRYLVDNPRSMIVITEDPDPTVITITLAGQSQDVWAPTRIRSLFTQSPRAAAYNPSVRLGWNGPYLVRTGARYPGTTEATARGFIADEYAHPDDPVLLDGWGNPLVVRPIEDPNDGNHWAIISAGPDGNLNTTNDNLRVYLHPIELAP